MSSVFVDFVKNGSKILAIGANYKSAIRTLDKPKPKTPAIFMKPTTSYITEKQCIKIPPNFQLNQEIELGVIIGRTCRNIEDHQGMNYVGGYCLALDMTATCQMKLVRANGLPWTIGKGFDTACPVSRFISLAEIPDPTKIEIWSSVNGVLRQCCGVNDLLFTIPEIIAYISRYITLLPNDLILTGSPPGMGPVKSGDYIEGGIKGLLEFKFNVLDKTH